LNTSSPPTMSYFSMTRAALQRLLPGKCKTALLHSGWVAGRQQAFVDFVLAQCVEQGVEELDTDKLSPLLKPRYRNAMADALSDLGSAAQIRQVFVGFQRYLYQG
ncbi:MAG: hypothetical protein MUP33_01340, partial [Polaromonas sp.]|nr:hypothetical protein [Polaromonas sp.]